jgi:N-acetylglutamate synthase-like GNAT family acetyltransferase
MTSKYSLPPGFVVRPSEKTDNWKIQKLFVIWDIKDINPKVIWLILLFIAMLFMWQILLIFIAIWFISLIYVFTVKQYSNFWVIERKNSIIGCAELRNYRKYSIILNLFIKREYRYQKLGSFMVEYLTQQARKPVYLSCYHNLITFYQRFGFKLIEKENLSPELQAELSLNQNLSIVPLVLY